MFLRPFLALLLTVPLTLLAEVRVDADYAGGNIVVQKIEGDTVYVAPDLSDIQKGHWWFYWNFRLQAPAGQPVKVVFSDKNPIGVRGPAVSIDEGLTWRWLGTDAVTASNVDGKPTWSFQAVVPSGAKEVRFAFAFPYTETNFARFLEPLAGNPALRKEELCRSRKGRSVELLRAGRLVEPEGYVLLTARHHCCETMASYAMEGFLNEVLENKDSPWHKRWQVVAVPFVDKDGTEDGDQGKNREPHDHNRDYNETPLYPEVKSIIKLGESMKDRVVAFLDMHCPHIRGKWNDRVYFVGPENERLWNAEVAFAETLQRIQKGPIRFRAEDCLKFGTAWNTGGNYKQGRSSARWAGETFPNAQFAATLEIAYADAHGDEVNDESARALGRDLARAFAEFLK